jgi:hypothetical protein
MPASHPDRSSRLGAEFEVQVVDAYRALGFQVVHNIQMPGKQTDLLARRQIAGAPPIVLAVECKDESRPVGNEEVLAFVSRIVAQRGSAEITSGVMVSRSGYTKDARAAVTHHPYITLLTWDDLTAEILDVRHQLRELIADYAASPICHEYVPARYERVSWDALGAEDAGALPHGRSLVGAWLESGPGPAQKPSPRLVLGDFGAGKTTLLRHLEYEAAQQFLAGADARIPLFVPLINFRETHDLNTLLRAAFRDRYYRDVPGELLWRRLEEGAFWLFLDAFDEMAARSDARRRLDLFHLLLPALASRSPAILTSRPGYFAGRGELRALVGELHLQEAESIAGSPGRATRGSVEADALLRKLIERRHTPPRSLSYTAVNFAVRGLDVYRLLPLDSARVADLVHHRGGELTAVGLTSDQLLGFIARTYDLSDLATRPLLLTMIIDTVVEGRLDLDDTSREYGPSGLYELYVEAKLTVDLGKHRSRAGLKPDLRRSLTERLAIAMYQAGVFEADFAELLPVVTAEDEALRMQLVDTGLSDEEVATDVASSAFITLDHTGVCQFVHRSFRGFFVARVLRQPLDRAHALWHQELDAEILYFIGGFAPTEADKGEGLWTRFAHAAEDDAVLRRNLLMACLHTRPTHTDRVIVSGAIWEARYSHLTFVRPTLSGGRWRDTVIGALTVEGGVVSDLELVDSQLTSVRVTDAVVGLSIDRVIVEAADVRDSSLMLTGQGLECGNLWCERTRVGIELEESRVQVMSIVEAVCKVEGSGDERVIFDEVLIDRGWFAFAGAAIETVVARRCVIKALPRSSSIAKLSLAESVVLGVVNRSRSDNDVMGPLLAQVDQLELDSASIVVFDDGVYLSRVRGLACGVFGHLIAESAVPHRVDCWGIVEGEVLIDEIELPVDVSGVRCGDLLFVTKSFYAHHVLRCITEADEAGADGTKSSDRVPRPESGTPANAMRTLYEKWAALDWPHL